MPRSHKRIEELENQAAEFADFEDELEATEEMARQHLERGEPVTGFNLGRLVWMLSRVLPLYRKLFEYWKDHEMRRKDD